MDVLATAGIIAAAALLRHELRPARAGASRRARMAMHA